MPIQIYDPTTEVAGRNIAYVPRPKSLDGLRIGLVDNTKHNSDQLLVTHREHSRARARREGRTSSARRKARAPHRTRYPRGIQGELRRHRRGCWRLRLMFVGECPRQHRIRAARRASASIVTHVSSRPEGDGARMGPSPISDSS